MHNGNPGAPHLSIHGKGFIDPQGGPLPETVPDTKYAKVNCDNFGFGEGGEFVMLRTRCLPSLFVMIPVVIAFFIFFL